LFVGVALIGIEKTLADVFALFGMIGGGRFVVAPGLFVVVVCTKILDKLTTGAAVFEGFGAFGAFGELKN